MIWRIVRNGMNIGTSDKDTGDKVELWLSFFRGPNQIVWEHYHFGYEEVIPNTHNDDFELVIYGDYGGIALLLNMYLESIYFDHNKKCQCFLFTPRAVSYCNNTIFIHNPNTKLIKNVCESIITDDKIKIIMAKEMDIKFNQFTFRGRIIDFLAEITTLTNTELYIDDTEINIGIIRDRRKPVAINLFNNNASNLMYNGVQIKCLTTDYFITRPGGFIKWDSLNLKVFCVHATLTDSYITNSMYCIEANQAITEFTVANILPSQFRDHLLQICFPERHITLGKTTLEDKGFDKKVNIFNTTFDVTKPGFLENVTSIQVEQGSPYAGETVGLQFPINKGAIGVIVDPNGQKSSSIEVAQVYPENKSPKRDDPEDFRLTLPDGGSLYYKKSTGEWILAAKSKVTIGVQSTVSSNIVPNPTQYIEMNGSSIIIKNGDTGKTITISNTTVNVS